MKQYLVIAWLIISAVSTTTNAATQNDAQNQAAAAALWEEAIRAKGGRERLQSVQNLLISSTVEFSGGSREETERLYVMPAKAWIYTHNPENRTSLDATVMNFEHKFCMVTLSPPFSLSPCLPETPLQYLVQDPVIYLMETKWVRPQPLRVRTEGKGDKQLDVIETKVGSLRVDFYLDRKTRLPIKLVTGPYGGVAQVSPELRPMTIELKDYVAIDGIMMPRRVTREPQGQSPAQELRRDYEDAKYRFNVAYKEKLFESTVSPKAKRTDWMP